MNIARSIARSDRILVILSLVCLALLVWSCAAPPGQPADPKEPTDRILRLTVTTSPEPELLEAVINASYGPEAMPLPADDGKPFVNYVPDGPIVSPWGREFRLNAETERPLKASVRIKTGRKVKVTCNWYIGSSITPVWVDKGTGETVCQYQMS